MAPLLYASQRAAGRGRRKGAHGHLHGIHGSWLLGVKLGLGVVGVWIAMVADWVVRTICFLLRVRQKLWKEHP